MLHVPVLQEGDEVAVVLDGSVGGDRRGGCGSDHADEETCELECLLEQRGEEEEEEEELVMYRSIRLT